MVNMKDNRFIDRQGIYKPTVHDRSDFVVTYLMQGALYLVLGENKRSLVTKRNWDVIMQLWPALVRAQLHCEKPSMLKLFDEVIDKLHSDIETTELSLVVS